MNNLVFIKDLKIYGYVTNDWTVFDEFGKSTTNYIIKDLIGIEHERFQNEIELVDDIETSIKKAKCNIPLEKLLELFTLIDKRYTLYVEFSQQKENCHSDIYVPYIFVCYGKKILNETLPCIIKNGELTIPKSIDFTVNKDQYECAIFYYDTDFKDAIFELYMNIITKLKNNFERRL